MKIICKRVLNWFLLFALKISVDSRHVRPVLADLFGPHVREFFYLESFQTWTQLPCPPRIQSRGWNHLSYFSGLSILYKFGWISLQPYFGQNQSIVELLPPLVLEAAASSILPTPPFFDYGGRFLMNHIGFTKPFKSNYVQFLCCESSY